MFFFHFFFHFCRYNLTNYNYYHTIRYDKNLSFFSFFFFFFFFLGGSPLRLFTTFSHGVSLGCFDPSTGGTTR